MLRPEPSEPELFLRLAEEFQRELTENLATLRASLAGTAEAPLQPELLAKLRDGNRRLQELLTTARALHQEEMRRRFPSDR